MSSSNVVVGAVRIQGLPEEACFETFEDFLEALQQYLVVEIPRSITNVIFSTTEPAADQRSFLWVRYNTGGGFIGLYIYAGGGWQQITPARNQVFWFYGDSDNPPAGYSVVDSSNPNFTAAEVAHIEGFFYPSGGPPYSYYAATFSGF